MAMTVPAKIGRCMLWISPVVIIPIAFLASIPWLKDQNDAVALGIAAAAGIFVMVYATVLAVRVSRRQDEVQRAGQGFALAQGTTIGWVATPLVIMFPPATNALVGLAKSIAAGSPDAAIVIGIIFGFMLLAIMQTLGVFVASAVWARRVGYR